MTKKIFVFLCIVGFILKIHSAQAQQDGKLNFLLITVSDMAWNTPDDWGALVSGVTPNINRLARSGIRFNHAHVNVAAGQPSRQVLMTGRYPQNNGSWACDAVSDTITTLSKVLHDNGYYNAILGEVAHLAPQDIFAWDKIVIPEEIGQGRDPSKFYNHFKSVINGAKSGNQPFFAMVNIHDAQRPYHGSEAEKIAKNEWNKTEVPPRPDKIYKAKEIKVPAFLPDIQAIRNEIAQYYSTVRRGDQCVGKIMQALKESGLKNKTVVIFLSDNGMAFPFAKSNCYSNSTKTPWIVVWNGVINPNSVDDEHFISGIDYMSTILDIAGIKNQIPVDGKSFKDILQGKKDISRDHVYTLFNGTIGKRPYPMRAIYTKEFGYIVNLWSNQQTVYKNNTQSGLAWRAMIAESANNDNVKKRIKQFSYRNAEEFYILKDDPDALDNKMATFVYPKKINDLKKQLYDEMKKHNDPFATEYHKRFIIRR